jgi:hypothetical protein
VRSTPTAPPTAPLPPRSPEAAATARSPGSPEPGARPAVPGAALGPVEPAELPRRRGPLYLGAAAAGLLLFATGGALGWWFLRGRHRIAAPPADGAPTAEAPSAEPPAPEPPAPETPAPETPAPETPATGSAPLAAEDAGFPDAGFPDAGPPDAGPLDGGSPDGGADAGADAGLADAGADGGRADAGPSDAGTAPEGSGADTADGRSRDEQIRHLIRSANYARNRGQLGPAERDYLRVLRLQPRNARALAGLTRLAMSRRDGTQARRWARQLVEAHPRNANNHVLLGDVYRQFGDPRAAARHWRRALELSPGHPGAQRRLAR